MSTSPQEPLKDEDIETTGQPGGGTHGPLDGADADGTDGGDADGTDGPAPTRTAPTAATPTAPTAATPTAPTPERVARSTCSAVTPRPSSRRSGRPACTCTTPTPTRLVGLLSLDDVDRLLTGTAIRTPAVRVARDGSVLPASAFTRPATLAGQPMTGLVDPRKVFDLVRRRRHRRPPGPAPLLAAARRAWSPTSSSSSATRARPTPT